MKTTIITMKLKNGEIDTMKIKGELRRENPAYQILKQLKKEFKKLR
jgi:hypothetical protein